ncbi:hypothetical protein ACFL2V_12015 [Pseudomonadota bacterium]
MYTYAQDNDFKSCRYGRFSSGRLPLLVAVSLLVHVVVFYALALTGPLLPLDMADEAAVLSVRILEDVDVELKSELTTLSNSRDEADNLIQSNSPALDVPEQEPSVALAVESISEVSPMVSMPVLVVKEDDAISLPQTITAQQILKSGSEIIKSQSYQPESNVIGEPQILLGMGYLVEEGAKAQSRIVDSYRLPNGNQKVQVHSLLGGVQCFEVPADTPLDAYSPKLWMFSRC